MKMCERTPDGWGKDSVSSFIEAARCNMFAAYDNLEMSRLLIDINDAMELTVQNMNEPGEANLVPVFLLCRTHASYLAAARLSLSGQTPEAYMVMRGCLESQLYAFHIHNNPGHDMIWMKRHVAPVEESRRQVIKNFRPRDILESLQKAHAKVGSVARDLYETTIDYGAHPNVSAVTSNLDSAKNGKKYIYNSHYFAGPGVALKLCLKTNAMVGVSGLDIFGIIFQHRFAILGVTERLAALKQTLSRWIAKQT